MALALYRKYRPQSFSELIGQNHIKVTLQSEIEKDRVAHAYLFTGPRGIGKTTTARIFAKAVNCQKINKNGEPCNNCSACREIVESKSIDLIEIDAASHTGVDNVRENIIENARFAPSRLKYKVFIIDEVHMLSLSAFNALLKILEEPPAHVIFILATTEVHKLPETIISRCQRFDFRKLNYADIVQRLDWIIEREKIKVDKTILDIIARRSDGSVRDAESVLGQILALGEKEISKDQALLILPRSDIQLVRQMVEHLVDNDTSKGLSLINQLLEDGVNLIQFNYELIDFLRKLILIKVVGSLDTFSTMEFDQDTEKNILAITTKIELTRLTDMINVFIRIERDLKSATELPQLPLELAIIELTREQPTGNSDQSDSEPKGKSKKLIKPKKDHQPLTESVKEKSTPLKSVSFKQAEKAWSKMIKDFFKTNHSLALILRTCQLADMDNDQITVGTSYQIYFERLKKPENFKMIEDKLTKLLGRPIKTKFVLVQKSTVSSTEENRQKGSVFDSVLQTFGGEVVD